MEDHLIPINCFPWGGSCRPEAYAIATGKADAISFRLWCFEKHPRITCTEPNSAAACGNTTTPAIHAEQIKNDTFSPRFLNMPRPKTGPVLRIL